MPETPSAWLKTLVRIHQTYGPDSSAPKLTLLRKLERRRLSRADEVHRLHEILCFLDAYPDDAALREQVQGMLAAFSERGDLRRFARALADTGIAGTATHYAFFWPTARWLARRWPKRLEIDWGEFSGADALDWRLNILMPYGESLGMDNFEDFETRDWVNWFKGPDETDAAFLVKRMERLRASDAVREQIFNDLVIPLRLAPGPGAPSRTGARTGTSSVVYQTGPLDRRRPDLRKEVRHPPLSVKAVPRKEGKRLIDLARQAMILRERDLYAFQYCDPDDVRLVDYGEGLQFVVMGLVPERRLPLEAIYGCLTLKNGVPIGYVLFSAYFNSAEVAYNVFDTFRGGESARIYGHVLGLTRHLFGADAFVIDPYQLGHENTEGLRSGAWWFYYKLGFRPRDPEVKRLVREERKAMRADPRHRTTIPMLNRISAANMYLTLGKPREDMCGLIRLGRIGLAMSRTLADRFGSDREQGLKTCSAEAARQLGVRSFRAWTPGEKLAWERWSPLILSLPGLERWTREEKRALARVVRAKGGRRDSDYLRLFDGHRKLRRALLKLAAREYESSGV